MEAISVQTPHDRLRLRRKRHSASLGLEIRREATRGESEVAWAGRALRGAVDLNATQQHRCVRAPWLSCAVVDLGGSAGATQGR